MYRPPPAPAPAPAPAAAPSRCPATKACVAAIVAPSAVQSRRRTEHSLTHAANGPAVPRSSRQPCAARRAKLAKAADMMRSLAAMIQHAIGPSKDVFIEPDTGRKLSDAYAIIVEIEGESHD